MKRPVLIMVVFTLLTIAVMGCDGAPGRLRSGAEVPRPSQVLDFDRLYRQNCAGCHGLRGGGGPATALSNPVYLEIANDATIRRATARGIPGTAMPAFALSSGGMLTDQQINAIIAGIRARWTPPSPLDATPPSYNSAGLGDPKRGLKVYETYCSSCHGKVGGGGKNADSIVDASFLSLVSDQYLRTIVIAGRPELGAPDWRGNVHDKPMSEQEVSDVVAWLSAQRPRLALSAGAESSIGGTQ